MDVNKEAEASDFYKKYPFYSKVVIPKGIYPGQTAEVATFQDSTLWIANKDVDAELVYKALAAIFSADGLAHMVKAHQAASEMSIKNGVTGVSTPLHKGAYKFWKEKGIDIPDSIKPVD